MQTNSDYFTKSCLNKILHLKGVKCCSGKHSKVRLTGLADQMFVIRKSVKPRGFKTLPCRYRAQHKSWMSGELFEDWVHALDRKFVVSKRKIAVIIDNCTAHPHVEYLKWVELIFLPPNTTSHTQPMDQGIIRVLKAKYRSLAVHKLSVGEERADTNIFHFFSNAHAEKSMGYYLEPDIDQLLQKIGNLGGCSKGDE